MRNKYIIFKMNANKPQERYYFHLNSFDEKLNKALDANKKNPLLSLGHFLYISDARTPFFQLQGLARIEDKSGKNDNLGLDWLNQFKKIEDALGKYDYWITMIKNNERWKFPKEIENYFHQQANFYLGVLEERLINQGWIIRDLTGYKKSDNAMSNFKNQIKNAEWYKPEKESKKLARLLRDEAQEIHDKICEKEIDIDHIELGIHEFRRKIRWLGIYSSALLGKVKLSNNNASDPLKIYITKTNQDFKFNQLPTSNGIENTVSFLRGGFYAMSDIIKIIGDIKDPGLATEEMLNIGSLFGLSKDQIANHLGNEYYPHDKVVDDAKEHIEKLIFTENTLQYIADHFDKQS